MSYSIFISQEDFKTIAVPQTLIDLDVDLTKAHFLCVCVCVFEHSCVGDPPNHKPSQLSELWFLFLCFLGGRTFVGYM